MAQERIPGTDKNAAAAAARLMLRTRRLAALATALASEGGRPYCSLVTIACDCDGSPILLLSKLADHTRNLDPNPLASLLLEDAGRRSNPQTGPRLTLLGRINPDEEPRLRRRFLARHPGACQYAEFADFRIFRMTIESAHWVGGFAQARRLEAGLILADADAARTVADIEPSVLIHMNTDHRGALDLFAQGLLGRAGSGWKMVSVDPEGCDLSRRNGVFCRITFPRLATDASVLREILTALAAAARQGSGSAGP